MEKFTKDIYGKILGVLFILSSLPKLIPIQAAADNFIKWHLGDTWRYVVGSAELIFGILMFIPQTKKYAAFGFFLIMPAAVITHIIAGEATNVIAPLVLGTAIFVYLYRKEILSFNKIKI
jgi:uncharacterized membrane protein YphA (DoxX/SURF4 family)